MLKPNTAPMPEATQLRLQYVFLVLTCMIIPLNEWALVQDPAGFGSLFNSQKPLTTIAPFYLTGFAMVQFYVFMRNFGRNLRFDILAWTCANQAALFLVRAISFAVSYAYLRFIPDQDFNEARKTKTVLESFASSDVISFLLGTGTLLSILIWILALTVFFLNKQLHTRRHIGIFAAILSTGALFFCGAIPGQLFRHILG